MNSAFQGPLNIGSEEMVSINELTEMVAKIAGKNITIRNIPGPTGVRGRNSDNKLIREKLGWAPAEALEDGLKKTYQFVSQQVTIRRLKDKKSNPATRYIAKPSDDSNSTPR
jgi:nucleoside-diphosphate-sugar epimerase